MVRPAGRRDLGAIEIEGHGLEHRGAGVDADDEIAAHAAAASRGCRPCCTALPVAASNRCIAAGGRVDRRPCCRWAHRCGDGRPQPGNSRRDRAPGGAGHQATGWTGRWRPVRAARPDGSGAVGRRGDSRPRPLQGASPPTRRAEPERRRAHPGPRPRAWAPRPRRTSTTFIGGSPMKLATNRLVGSSFKLGRRGILLQNALLHDRDPVGKGDRLGLVVGDEHRRHSVLDQIVLDAGSQDRPQLRLELRHGLVEQRDRRCATRARARLVRCCWPAEIVGG